MSNKKLASHPRPTQARVSRRVLLRIKPVVLAVSGALIGLPQIVNAGNNAAVDILHGQTSMPIPSNGVVDATASDLKTGIAAIGNGTDKISSSYTGADLVIKVGEYKPGQHNYTTHGVLAQKGATLNFGSNDKPLTKFEIQNHGKTTLATGIMTFRGDNPKKTQAHVNINADIVDINVSSEDYWAYGLYTYNDTTDKNIADADRSSIVINAKDINIDVSSKIETASVGIIAWSQSKVALEADRIKVKAYRAINTRGDSIVSINGSGNKDSVVQIDGNIAFEYNGPSSGTPIDSNVTINLLNSASYWNGNLECGYSQLDPNKNDKKTLLAITKVHLGLANGAEWTPEVVNTVESESNGKP